MSAKTTIHCDQCDDQVDYLDYDQDRREIGFLLEGGPLEIQYRNHCPTNCGSSSSPIPKLVLPENICSKDCMLIYFTEWVDRLPEITDGRGER